MPKCKKCGRKGLFFKVNHIGLCTNCETLNWTIVNKVDKKNENFQKNSFRLDWERARCYGNAV
mgnify:CR=1 FL=1